jgi:hypothetical protein
LKTKNTSQPPQSQVETYTEQEKLYSFYFGTKSKFLRRALTQVAFFHFKNIPMYMCQERIGSSNNVKRQCANRNLQILWRMGFILKKYITIPGTDIVVCQYILAPIVLTDYLSKSFFPSLLNSIPFASDTPIRLILMLITDFRGFLRNSRATLEETSQKSLLWDTLVG